MANKYDKYELSGMAYARACKKKDYRRAESEYSKYYQLISLENLKDRKMAEMHFKIGFNKY